MEKIFDRVDDLHVAARLIYAKANDVYAYANSAKTKKIDAATLKDLYIKGALIVDGSVYYKPLKLIVDAGVATVTYVKADTTTATTAVLATLVSKEYTPAPLISLTIEPEDSGTELLGKLASDLQADVVIDDNEIIGTLHYVTGYTGFSGNADMQSGNYIALKFAITPADAVTTVEVVGGTSDPVTLDFDLNAVLKITDITTQQIRVISQKEGYQTETVVLDISGLTCESATPAA